MMLTAGSISLSDSLVDFFQSDRIRRGDLGEYSDDSRRFPAPVPRHQTQVRTAAALHDRFRYAADQPAGSEYVPFRTVRRRTYPLGKFHPGCRIARLSLSGCEARYLPVSDLHRCRCHDRFRPADRQPEEFHARCCCAVGYFRDLPGGLTRWASLLLRPVVSVSSAVPTVRLRSS